MIQAVDAISTHSINRKDIVHPVKGAVIKLGNRSLSAHSLTRWCFSCDICKNATDLFYVLR
jgi:hypothetical protein